MNQKTILVVDDEPQLTEMLKTRLEANSYKVIRAHDGTECLVKAQEDPPDIILLDIKMQKMDGYMALRRLRQDERTKKIPVIMLTAYEHMKDLFAVEGISDFIIKPFNHQDLLKRIAQVLEKQDA